MGKTDELQQKRSEIIQGGGSEMIKKQHDAGKMTARERLSAFFDEGSFIENDVFVKGKNLFKTEDANCPSEGVVTGYGTVCGRLVYAYAQDYTVSKGALTASHADKICRILDMALKMGAPVVSMLDSQGAKIEEGLEIVASLGKVLKKTALLSGVVPQISIILGTCAGGAAFVPVLGDFVIMSEKNSLMFLNGPSVSGKAMLSPEDVGGADVCAVKGGTASLVCGSEDECFDKAKALLDFLPSNNIESAPYEETADDINRVSEALKATSEDIASQDAKNIIKEIADGGEFFELGEKYAQNMVTGFIRLNGASVGVAANQAKVDGGAIDVRAAKKCAEFIRTCDSFNIPVLSITNTRGFSSECGQELLKSGAEILYAFAEATVPKVNVITGKAAGSSYLVMNSKQTGADIVFAWPGAEISVLSSESAANILFNDEIANSADPMKKREEVTEKYKNTEASPYVAASLGYVDDVIEADSTRPRLISAFEMLMSKREVLPPKKHGNMPL